MTATDTTSPTRQRLLHAIFAHAERYVPADTVAQRLGLGNRHRLNRRLREERLPSFRQLSTIARLAAIHRWARRHGRSMRKAAKRFAVSPTWVSRHVHQFYGCDWRTARQHSTASCSRHALRACIRATRSEHVNERGGAPPTAARPPPAARAQVT